MTNECSYEFCRGNRDIQNTKESVQGNTEPRDLLILTSVLKHQGEWSLANMPNMMHSCHIRPHRGEQDIETQDFAQPGENAAAPPIVPTALPEHWSLRIVAVDIGCW